MPKINNNLKFFLSYSHIDESYVEEFVKHIAPLKNILPIEYWYDRRIASGEEFDSEIKQNIYSADIIVLFISANFLASDACLDEKKIAFKLNKKRGVITCPVILESCGWLDDPDLCTILALPTDGKPITEFVNLSTAWNDVYKGIKKVAEQKMLMKELKISEKFTSFLDNTELLAKAHSQKTVVQLSDIFVYPELSKYDNLREYEKKINSAELISDIYNYPNIVIAGENQAGKTTLCKQLYLDLFKNNYIPIYIFDKAAKFSGKVENRVLNAFQEQYGTKDIDLYDKSRFVIILDDFHLAQKKEKHLHSLSEYKQIIVIVDDIFNLNFKNESLIDSFAFYRIEEFTPSLRNELITKWTHLTDTKDSGMCPNYTYQKIDNNTELVNATLGKMFGNGIMPAYPFFILSVISTYEAFSTPLDQEITSQGYCYQALIYMYLRKYGVKNDEVDTYINFLTEFAYFFYSKGKNEISNDVFKQFMCLYLQKFNLPISQESLLNNLCKSNLMVFDDFGNHYFSYKYIYYFFVAKYISENIKDKKDDIDHIINNLHDDKNAYIAIFISHHSKDSYILDEIMLNAYCLFDKNKPATLKKDELNFFDKQKDIIIKAILPAANANPESERKNKLKVQDIAEENNSTQEDDVSGDELIDLFLIDLRRSIKTVEVMGRIIKNRSGSLEKPRLEELFEEAMKVHFRVLSSFFELIKHKSTQDEIIHYILNSIENHLKEQAKTRKKDGKANRKPSKEQLEKLSKSIFWNLNFFVIYGLINKVISSLGSHKLTTIIETICDKEDTPASFLVKHGILMWYNKNLQLENINKGINGSEFSHTAKKVMELMIVNHCSMHKVGFREKQRISNTFNIPSEKLLKQKT